MYTHHCLPGLMSYKVPAHKDCSYPDVIPVRFHAGRDLFLRLSELHCALAPCYTLGIPAGHFSCQTDA